MANQRILLDKLLDPERIEQRRRKHIAACRATFEQPGRVAVIDAAYWIQKAEQAGVPVIPMALVTTFPTQCLWDWVNTKNTWFNEWLNERWLLRNTPANYTQPRFAHVVSTAIKAQAAEGGRVWKAPPPVTEQLDLDDPRLLETLYSWMPDSLSLYARPWIEPTELHGRTPARHDGPDPLYPAELRVFVRDGAVEGVSNYYPQAFMDPDAFAEHVELVREYAERILQQVIHDGEIPTHPSLENAGVAPQASQEITCTLDFLIDGEGAPRMLEGGPGHYPAWGAHPCCFAPGQISGVAYAPQPGSPLAEDTKAEDTQ